MPLKSEAQQAYEKHAEGSGWRDQHGRQMWTWEHLPPMVRDVWHRVCEHQREAHRREAAFHATGSTGHVAD